MQAKTRLRLAIAGGSLGGLTAALVLRDAGHDVQVFERSPEPLADRGAGIILHPVTVRYLTQRQGDLNDISVAANSIRYLDRAGRLLCEMPCRFRSSSYFALYRALLRYLPMERYHLGCSVVGVTQGDDGATLDLADGSEARCDVAVFADGIHSTGRRLLAPEVVPHYAGYIAWRGTVDEADLTPGTFSRLVDSLCYYVMPGSHILTYPIPTPSGMVESGRRLLNWVWYRNIPEGAELTEVMTDRQGVQHRLSLAPGIVRPEHVDRLRRTAAAGLPPPLAEIVDKTAEPFVQAIVDVAVPRMVFGRACLIGDAAFAARPHVAAGTAKAVEDGWKLAEILATFPDVDEALRRWEARQLALGRAVIARTQEAGDRIQHHGTWRLGDPLPFGLYRVGDSALPDDR